MKGARLLPVLMVTLLVAASGGAVAEMQFTHHETLPYSMQALDWSPDGRALIVGASGSASLYSEGSLEHLSSSTGAHLTDVAWNPSGSSALITGSESYLSTGSVRGTVMTYDGKTIAEYNSSFDVRLNAVAWEPSGKYALVVGDGGTVLKFDQGLQALDSGTDVNFYDVSFDSKSSEALLVGGKWNGTTKEMESEVLAFDGSGFTQVFNGTANLFCCAWNPRGGRALIGGDKLFEYDSDGLTEIPPRSEYLFIRKVAWRPMSDQAYLIGEGATNSTVAMYDGKYHSITEAYFADMAWHPNGKWALALAETELVKYSDVEDRSYLLYAAIVAILAIMIIVGCFERREKKRKKERKKKGKGGKKGARASSGKKKTGKSGEGRKKQKNKKKK